MTPDTITLRLSEALYWAWVRHADARTQVMLDAAERGRAYLHDSGAAEVHVEIESPHGDTIVGWWMHATEPVAETYDPRGEPEYWEDR